MATETLTIELVNARPGLGYVIYVPVIYDPAREAYGDPTLANISTMLRIVNGTGSLDIVNNASHWRLFRVESRGDLKLSSTRVDRNPNITLSERENLNRPWSPGSMPQGPATRYAPSMVVGVSESGFGSAELSVTVAYRVVTDLCYRNDSFSGTVVSSGSPEVAELEISGDAVTVCA